MTNPIEKDEPLRAAVVTAVQNFLAETGTGSFCLNEALPGKLILAGEPAKLRLLLGMAMEDAPAAAPAVLPAGWKAMPEKLTPEMAKAGAAHVGSKDEDGEAIDFHESIGRAVMVFAEMCAAAPKSNGGDHG